MSQNQRQNSITLYQSKEIILEGQVTLVIHKIIGVPRFGGINARKIIEIETQCDELGFFT